MADVVVCVPRAKWRDWIGEGVLAGQSSTQRFGFYVRSAERPPIEPGDRVYVIAWDRLRGYAPLVELKEEPDGYTFVRTGNAVSCTLPAEVKGFPGWKLRWWQLADEQPFAGWQVDNVGEHQLPKAVVEQRRRAEIKLAFAPVVKPHAEKPMKPEEIERMFADALAEIDATGSLSFSSPGRRDVFVIRCGERVTRSRLCLRPRKHQGDCSPEWSNA